MNRPSTVVIEPNNTIQAMPSSGMSARTSEMRRTIGFAGKGTLKTMCRQMRAEKMREGRNDSSALAPVANFFQALGMILRPEPDSVPGMLELVNVGPNFGPPRL